MIYNIIGDIHGRTSWKELVQEDAINIFIGDYFDPYLDYNDIPFIECKANFLEIIEYKKQHPETVLLIGNHDIAYWHIPGDNNRYEHKYRPEIYQLFEDNKDLFQLAYSIENKALVTHAGVSIVWYERFKNGTLAVSPWDFNYDDPDELENPFSKTHEKIPFENPLKFSLTNSPEEAWQIYANKAYKYWADENKKPSNGIYIEYKDKLWRYNKEIEKFEEYHITPDEVADFINSLWFKKEKYNAFEFMRSMDDNQGNNPRQSPAWIREEALRESNIFKFTDYWQFFGHTQCFWYIEKLNLPKDLTLDKIELRMIDKKNKFVNCDCLSYSPMSILYNSDTEEIRINKKN